MTRGRPGRDAIFGSMPTSICTVEHDVDYRLLKVPGTMQLIRRKNTFVLVKLATYQTKVTATNSSSA